ADRDGRGLEHARDHRERSAGPRAQLLLLRGRRRDDGYGCAAPRSRSQTARLSLLRAMTTPRWRELSAWRLHSLEFGNLGVFGKPEVPVFEMHAAEPAWLELGPHPNLLAAVNTSATGMVLRYAVLAWERRTTEIHHRAVRWGRQLVA